MKEEIKREIVHQAKIASRITQVRPTPDHIIERYRKHKLWRLFPKEFLFRFLKDIAGKEILDFGCGTGTISTQVAKLGGCVTAVDVSPELIKLAKRRAELDKVQDRLEFIVRDVTEYPFPENKFDYIICHDVLHHTDIYKTVPLLYSWLKRGGIAIMVEPTAFSPLLQKIRDKIPIKKAGSPVERQLNKNDLDFLVGVFDNSHVVFFNLFGRLRRLFVNSKKIDKRHLIEKTVVIFLLSFDRILLRFFPFLWRYYGTTVIAGQKLF